MVSGGSSVAAMMAAPRASGGGQNAASMAARSGPTIRYRYLVKKGNMSRLIVSEFGKRSWWSPAAKPQSYESGSGRDGKQTAPPEQTAHLIWQRYRKGIDFERLSTAAAPATAADGIAVHPQRQAGTDDNANGGAATESTSKSSPSETQAAMRVMSCLFRSGSMGKG